MYEKSERAPSWPEVGALVNMTLSHGLDAGYLQWQQQLQELGTIAATLLRSCMAAGQASVVATSRQHDGGKSMITGCRNSRCRFPPCSSMQ